MFSKFGSFFLGDFNVHNKDWLKYSWSILKSTLHNYFQHLAYSDYIDRPIIKYEYRYLYKPLNLVNHLASYGYELPTLTSLRGNANVILFYMEYTLLFKHLTKLLEISNSFLFVANKKKIIKFKFFQNHFQTPTWILENTNDSAPLDLFLSFAHYHYYFSYLWDGRSNVI